MLWTEKYRPETLDDILGNPSAVEAITKWAEDWNSKKKPLLLVGYPGTGKTSSVFALARTMDWELLEMNASDLRNKKNVQRVAGLASVSSTFSGKKRLILFDEVDGMFRQDYGGSSAVLSVVKTAKNPVVLTANDAYASALSTIRKYCTVVKFKKINYHTIAKRLGHICTEEKIDCEEGALETLAKRESGDMKSAINDLHALTQGIGSLSVSDVDIIGQRDTKENIFKGLRNIFKKESFWEAKNAFEDSDENPEMFMNWVEENIPREYEGEELVSAFNALALADLFAGRIMRRQDWGLMKYQLDFMTAGVALAGSPPGYTPYQFPSFIRKLSASKRKRSVRDSIASKVGAKIHLSKGCFVKEYLFLFKQLFKKNPEGFSNYFRFDEKELEFLGLSKAKAKKFAF